MASRRSNIKRTIAPAVVLMGLVFVLSYHLPVSQEESRDLDNSARAHLEKELAINKPRHRITVSAERGRAVQMLRDQEAAEESESQRPLEKALQAYLAAHRTTAGREKRVAVGSKVLIYTPGVVGWGNRVQGFVLMMACTDTPTQTPRNFRQPVEASAFAVLATFASSRIRFRFCA